MNKDLNNGSKKSIISDKEKKKFVEFIKKLDEQEKEYCESFFSEDPYPVAPKNS